MEELNKHGEKFFGVMDDLYGDSITVDRTSYVNSRNKVKVRCNVHECDYEAWPTNLTRGGNGCLQCSGKLTLDDFILKARAVHGNKFNYDKVEWVNTTTRVIVTCPMHGDWPVKPINHYHDGTDCPKCAINGSRLDRKRFIVKAIKKHGNRYDYSNVLVSRNTDRVLIGCKIHGEYEQEARVHLSGSGCPDCHAETNKKSLTEFIADAKRIHGNTYSYDNAVYVNSKTKLAVTCKIHGDFPIRPNNHISQKTGCPRCRESYGERMTAKVLDEMRIGYLKEYSFPGHKYRFDFYLPKLNILIEFHGIQHYEPVERFGGLDGHIEVLARDLRKTLLAEELDIPLIVLNYQDLIDDTLSDKLKKELAKFNSTV